METSVLLATTMVRFLAMRNRYLFIETQNDIVNSARRKYHCTIFSLFVGVSTLFFIGVACVVGESGEASLYPLFILVMAAVGYMIWCAQHDKVLYKQYNDKYYYIISLLKNEADAGYTAIRYHFDSKIKSKTMQAKSAICLETH